MIHQLIIKWNIKTVYHPRSPSEDSRIAAETAAYSAAVVVVAAVELAVAVDSAAWLVAAGPIPAVALLVVAKFLDSSHHPSAGFPSLGCDIPARYALAIPV